MQGQQNIGILPNQQQSPSDTLAQVNQQNYQRRQYEEAQKRQQQERQDMWLKEAYGQLDFKHFATGTVLDPVISSSLEEAKKAIARRIMDNPDITSASVMYDVANVAGDVNQYATKAKNVRAATEAAVKEYAKNPSVDGSTLLKGALSKAFMKYDEATHSFVPKDPSEIDDQQDYVTPTLGSAINSDDAFYERVNKAPMNPYKNEWTEDKGGVSREVAYEGKYSPIFHDLTDSKGNVVDGQKTPATNLKVKAQPIKFGDKVLQGATDETYRYFTSDPVTNAILEKQAKGIVAANPSLNMEDVKRVVLHDNLSNYTRGYINNTKNKVDNSQAWAAQERTARALEKTANALGKNGEVDYNNAYQKAVNTLGKAKPGHGIAFNEIPDDAQEAIMTRLNKVSKNELNPWTNADIDLVWGNDGHPWVRNVATGGLIMNITPSINVPATTGSKHKQTAQSAANNTSNFKFVNGKKKF